MEEPEAKRRRGEGSEPSSSEQGGDADGWEEGEGVAGPSTPQVDDATEAGTARRGRGRGRGRGDGGEAARQRFLAIARRRAAHFAHFDAEGDEAPAGVPPAQEEEEERRRGRRRPRPRPRAQAQAQGQALPQQQQEDWPGPFSIARRLVEGRASAAAARQQAGSSQAKLPLTDWQPSRSPSDAPSFLTCTRPSLQDLCLAILAANAENVESLEGVPDFLRTRISSAFCEKRKMNSKALSLFFQGEPAEIRVPDCTLIAETELTEILARFSASRLEVLQLGYCGRALSEQCLRATLARTSNCLASLSWLSLNGAYRLTDNGLETLLSAAPHVTGLDLSECSFLSEAGIGAVTQCVGNTLKTLILDDCKQFDARKLLPSLVRLSQLEKLSLTRVGGVNDEIISEISVQIGSHLTELRLSDNSSLTDAAMAAVGACCPSLKVLNLDNLVLLTDITIARIADGCRTLQILTLNRCKFSDEAVAAFVTASGGALLELSVNSVRQVADQTLLALAKHAQEGFKRLDASWCRQMTDEGLGYLADSCPNLGELILYGCTQVTERFVSGHSNHNLKIVGL